MSFIKAAWRKYVARIGIVDLLTAIIYGVVVLVVLRALGLWWLFPALLAVLICASALRAWVRARVGRRKSERMAVT
jgi:hypothetical protein